MMTVIQSVLPISLALIAGYIMGLAMPERVSRTITNKISTLVLALLFVIGFEFGEIFHSSSDILKVLRTATMLSIMTTIAPCLIIILFEKTSTGEKHTSKSSHHAWPLVKECLLPLLMVATGAFIYFIKSSFVSEDIPMISSNSLLTALIVMVGMDLKMIKLEKQWLSFTVVMIPFMVILGSLIGGVLYSITTGQSLSISLALSSGFGWFTLSSALVGNKLGQLHGSMALMTDLFRELIAIVLIYSIGKLRPKLAIGSAGATALDSTLPIIKQGCSDSEIPLALVSGFMLTILSPLFISFFLGLT